MGKEKLQELIDLVKEVRDLEFRLTETQLGEYIQYKTDIMSEMNESYKNEKDGGFRASREAYRDLRLYLYDTLGIEND